MALARKVGAMLATKQLKSSTIRDYFTLAKPVSILPHLVTAAAAMFLAVEGLPSVSKLVFTLLGGACLAAAANTFNCYLDRDIDAMMLRTRHRPLASGQLKPSSARAYGLIIGVVGVSILSIFVNWVAALLAVAALVYYMFPYTLWLKRRTYWGAVIGSGIGGFPPFIGWIAVTYHLTYTPFILAATVILWTLPHFWSLASYRRDDYERAGIKALPDKNAGYWIKVCSLLLVVASFLLVPAAPLSLFYLGIALILGISLLVLVFRMNPLEPLQGNRRLYRYSVLYLSLLFSAMIIDRLIFY